MTLRDLRQEHLDCWLTDGPTSRRRIRAFLAWARRGGLLPALQALSAEPRRHTDPLDADQRLSLVGTLLADDSLDLRDRVGGCLLLIFAQPVTHLARLTVDDVDDHARPVRLRLGPEPLELPEPLGTLVADLKQQRPGLATTAVGGRGRWLFPGLRLDAPLHPEHMRRRLRQHGITARPGRAAALLHLAQTLPPAILADLLGVSEGRAADWTRAATGDWAPLRRRGVPTAATGMNREPSSPGDQLELASPSARADRDVTPVEDRLPANVEPSVFSCLSVLAVNRRARCCAHW